MNCKPSRCIDMSMQEFLKTWEPCKDIGHGGYGEIVGIRERQTGHLYVIKRAINVDDVSIDNEVEVYEEMKKIGLHGRHAIMHSYGKLDGNNFLIMNQLGENISNIARIFNSGSGLPLAFVVQFGISGLRAIKCLHSSGFIHQDIKPDNFVCGTQGTKDVATCHLIDFGTASKYEIGEGIEKQHIPFKKEDNFYPGTDSFGTANQHEGYTATRRDDLESFLYSMVSLFKNGLPWDKMADKSISEENSRNSIIDLKRTMTTKLLCEGMPYQFKWFLEHVKSLRAAEIPDYKYLENCLVTSCEDSLLVNSCWMNL